MPNKIQQWHIIETKEMAKRSNTFANNKLKFYTSIDDVRKNKYDFIYINGTLQYTENPIQVLNTLLELQASYIYLARHPLSHKPTYFTTQSSKIDDNGPQSVTRKCTSSNKEIQVICAIINIDEFENAIQEHYAIQIKIQENQLINNCYLHYGLYVNTQIKKKCLYYSITNQPIHNI